MSSTHAYSAPGTYSVTLEVTDDRGARSTSTRSVVVRLPNLPPSASFTTAISGSAATFDAAGSNDPDGSLTSYAWNFGDGSTGIGARASHVYSSDGAYTVTLTVTDDRSASSLTSTAIVINTVAARDQFERTAANGWGSADVGGAWATTGTASRFNVTGGAGRMALTAPGTTNTAVLNALSQTNVDVTADFSTDKVPTGSGVQVGLIARRVGSTDYRVTARLTSTGTVTLAISKVVAGTGTSFGEKTINGLAYTPGDLLSLRLSVTQTGSTTALAAKVWRAGSTEPVDAQRSATDDTPSLQAAGAVGVTTYLAGNATNAPASVGIENLVVRVR